MLTKTVLTKNYFTTGEFDPGDRKIVFVSYKSDVLYNSIKDTDDETLITELAKRGYELKNTQKKKTTAEIVNIAI